MSVQGALSAVELSAAERLVEDAASLGVCLTDADAGRLLALLEELARWNRRYNLTRIRTLGAMVTHHLLDSLALDGEAVEQVVRHHGAERADPCEVVAAVPAGELLEEREQPTRVGIGQANPEAGRILDQALGGAQLHGTQPKAPCTLIRAID